MRDLSAPIRWQISVPIFGNPLIFKQLGLAVGIPFGLLAVVLAVAAGQSVYGLYALGLVAALLGLTWLFVTVFYKGVYDAEFLLDNRGALCRTQARQAKKNRALNALTVILGLFSRNPTAAGAGMLAQSRQEVFVRWGSVKKVKYIPKSRTILLKAGMGESVALFCTQENYPQVAQQVLAKTGSMQPPLS